MANFTQFSALFMAFALGVLLDIAHGGICYEPPSETGQCKASKQRWTYKRENNYCAPFLYGGCGATGNIFNTRGECYSACVKRSGSG